MSINLKPITIDDLEFLSETRHHPDTLPYIHDKRTFTIEETKEWFTTTKPKWFIIFNNHNERVGYIRMSDDDRLNWTIKIGCDIHPNFRRNGYATFAYKQLFELLIEQGYNSVWLEVLHDNYIARSLYEKLGFIYNHNLEHLDVSDTPGSLVMSKELCPSTGKNVKVLAIYLGYRRAFPPTPKATYQMLEYIIGKERTLDQGCYYDTLLVYNKFTDTLDDEGEMWLRRCELLLQKIDGTATKCGKFILEIRENVGFSFGAFNHAFLKYRQQYDYWLFTEDDQILVTDKCYAHAIEQFQFDKNIGCVAIVGVTTYYFYPNHVGGGVGVYPRHVLREVLRNNKTRHFPNGCLQHYVSTKYHLQEALGEIRFSNIIYELGYKLVDHDWVNIYVSWGYPNKRTAKAIPWEERFNIQYSQPIFDL